MTHPHFCTLSTPFCDVNIHCTFPLRDETDLMELTWPVLLSLLIKSPLRFEIKDFIRYVMVVTVWCFLRNN